LAVVTFLLLAAGRWSLGLFLPIHRFPALCDQIQDALVVLKPLPFGQVRVPFCDGLSQAGLVFLELTLLNELADFAGDCSFDARL
jgi:hypothetical protein